MSLPGIQTSQLLAKMIMYSDNPPCSCGSQCANFSLGDGTSKAVPSTQPVEQDTQLPNSFFRLPREVRDKIYFLAARPDCRFSLAWTGKCSKRHVHQSTEGRKSAWKFLILCRQSWSEAIQYMPLIKTEMLLDVYNDWNLHAGDCPRCRRWDDKKIREGVLHTSVSPMTHSSLRELWFVRVRKLYISLGVWDGSTNSTYRYPRFLHNLESLVSFIGKMKDLNQVTFLPATINEASSPEAKSVQKLFSILKEKQLRASLTVTIGRNESNHSCTCSTADDLSFCDECLRDPLIEQVSLAGFKPHEVSTSCDHTLWDFFSVWHPWVRMKNEPEWASRPECQTLYRASRFDEDFDSASNDVARTGCDASELKGPEYIVWQSCGVLESVGQETYKYKVGDRFLPLYFEDEFFHSSQENYYQINDCPKCRIVFASTAALARHSHSCRVGSPIRYHLAKLTSSLNGGRQTAAKSTRSFGFNTGFSFRKKLPSG